MAESEFQNPNEEEYVSRSKAGDQLLTTNQKTRKQVFKKGKPPLINKNNQTTVKNPIRSEHRLQGQATIPGDTLTGTMLDQIFAQQTKTKGGKVLKRAGSSASHSKVKAGPQFNDADSDSVRS